MVEQVEELGPELNSHSFANVRPLENGEVEVVDSGSAKRGVDPRFGARPKVWRGREAGRVKPQCWATRIRDNISAAGFLVAPRHNVRPDVPYSKICRFQRGRAGIADL